MHHVSIPCQLLSWLAGACVCGERATRWRASRSAGAAHQQRVRGRAPARSGGFRR